MHVCMDACMHVCMHRCMNLYVCMHAWMYARMYESVCMYVCMHVWSSMYVCMDVCMYVWICMYMYACMDVCMHVCCTILLWWSTSAPVTVGYLFQKNVISKLPPIWPGRPGNHLATHPSFHRLCCYRCWCGACCTTDLQEIGKDLMENHVVIIG